jgi:multidrug resistance protein, MATE family
MLTLAGPVVLAELGWMAMGIVDTIFVGRLGAEAIGAVSLGSALYFAVAIFGMGLLLGLDTLVSQAFGAGRRDECHRWLVQGLYLCLILSPLVMLSLSGGAPWLGRLGVHPVVLAQALPFLQALTWGTFPLFLYAAFRRYLQGMGLVKPVMFALVSANVINAVGDWILIYGHLGAPALGVTGSGWATTIARTYMAVVLVVYAVYREFRYRTGLRHVALRPHLAQIGRLVSIGLPAAVHVTLEVGVFAAATTLAGMLDPVALAAHHIVPGRGKRDVHDPSGPLLG